MLVITLGDPFSVNVELLAPLLVEASSWPQPTVLVGSAWHWRDQTARLGLPNLQPRLIHHPEEAETPGLYLADTGLAVAELPAEQLASVVRGALSLRALEWLRRLTPAGRLAVVTAPIDKYACAQAGFSHGGQTEFFAELWDGEAVMILAGPRLRVALATNHLALRDVPAALSEAVIGAKLALFADALTTVFGQARPRIAVCGLNPHASDQGLFGDEERLLIAPAIAAANERSLRSGRGAEMVGPVPADTAFYRAYHGAFAGVLAMYHDQGLGPLKTVHFDDAVNVSGGLKHFRVSPDHGPAQDLYLQHKASHASMKLALQLAQTYLTAPHRGAE